MIRNNDVQPMMSASEFAEVLREATSKGEEIHPFAVLKIVRFLNPTVAELNTMIQAAEAGEAAARGVHVGPYVILVNHLKGFQSKKRLGATSLA